MWILRFDAVMGNDREEMEEALDDIYEGQKDDFWIHEFGTGTTQVDYYEGGGSKNVLKNFANLTTIILSEHDHILDVITIAELSKPQLNKIRLYDGSAFDEDNPVFEFQSLLNISPEKIPTIAPKIDRAGQQGVPVFNIIVPEGLPKWYTETGEFDNDRITSFFENRSNYHKVGFNIHSPITGVFLDGEYYLLATSNPNIQWGPTAIIPLRVFERGIVVPDWMDCIYILVPYFRMFLWLEYRTELLNELDSKTYEQSEFFEDSNEKDIADYESRLTIVQNNWSEISRVRDELRKFNTEYKHPIKKDGTGVFIHLDLSREAGIKWSGTHFDIFKDSLKRVLREFTDDLTRLEEKQTNILDYVTAEISTRASIESVNLQRSLKWLSLVLIGLTIVLILTDDTIRSFLVEIYRVLMV